MAEPTINTLASTGRGLPPKRKPAPGPQPPKPSTVPAQRQNWLGPRYEPPNLSASATIQDIQTAIRQAENGETTQLFRLYRDCLLGDDHVQGELAKRKLAVIGQPMAILPEDKDAEEDLRAAAAITRMIADCDNWNTATGALLNACMWPVRVAEPLFKPADKKPVSYEIESDLEVESSKFNVGSSSSFSRRQFQLQFTLRKIEDVNPMLFCFRHAYLAGSLGLGTATPVQTSASVSGSNPYAIDLNDWEPFLRLWPIDDSGRILYDASRASRLDPARHVVHRGHLLTDQRDNWGGPFRAILMLWLMRGLGREWFGRFMERYGMPFPVGKTNVQDLQSVDLLQTAFSLATKIGGLVIGQDDAVELAAANVQGGAEGHKTWVTLCNDAISFAITGIKPSDQPGGLNQGQQVQVATIREDLRVLDQKLLAETLTKQLFRRALDYNGLPGSVKIVWGGLSEADATLFATMLKTLSDAGFEPTDEELPRMQEKVGLELQRKAPPAGLAGNLTGGNGENGDLETLSVRRHGRLIYFSAGTGVPRIAHPTDKIAADRAAALANAYRGAMAPFRQIILDSDSREDCLKKLSAAYADWEPGRLAAELDEALQLCAAAGASAAADHK